MKNKKTRIAIIASLVTVLGFSACKKDRELPDIDENEMITSIRLKFVDKANTADVRLFTWKDLDGQGGNSPIVDEIVLAQNRTYTLTVDAILDEISNPAKDITAEIAEDKNNHLFVFKPNPISLLSVTITDKDSKGLPVGLISNAVTTAAGTGKFQVILRHQVGTKDGTEAPGSSDIEAAFDLKVQ